MTNPEIVALLSDVVGVVEANSFEQHTLWKEYEKDWIEHRGGGPMVTVGELAGMPVCVSFFKATVKGHVVAFMDAHSQVVDHRLIDAFLALHLPRGARRTDAMNFSNVFPRAATGAGGE